MQVRTFGTERHEHGTERNVGKPTFVMMFSWTMAVPVDRTRVTAGEEGKIGLVGDVQESPQGGKEELG